MLDKGPRTIAGSTAPLQLDKSPLIPALVSTSVKGTEPDLKGPYPERQGKETEEPATLPSPCRTCWPGYPERAGTQWSWPQAVGKNQDTDEMSAAQLRS